MGSVDLGDGTAQCVVVVVSRAHLAPHDHLVATLPPVNRIRAVAAPAVPPAQ
eukprot:EC788155.1.p4 GENE.EC788155.1~~EC788155.1.p4  ORF type:complete len:52 (+),score=14.94 EC788155.1:224-379(+)